MVSQGIKANRIVSALIAFFMLVMISGVALAQEAGQLTIKAIDPNNAVVANASVSVKSVDTGRETTGTTNQEGIATIANLQPGLYDVTVNATGFAANTQRVQVTVGSKTSVEAQLGAKATEATVTVVAQGGVEVNTQDQQLSDVISREQVRELPTLTRNPYDLVGTAGNVTADTGGRGAGFAINGQRSASTSILLDGAENVDNFTATVGQQVPLDSVSEFRVITGNFSAEYGRASGGIVNVATISGTNSFHGTGYEFNRISRLASNGFDNNARGIPRQVFTRNQFGYSIGGPIKRNKAFFFSNTEWIRVRSGGARVAWVPTAQFLAAANPATRAFFAPYQLNATAGVTRTAAQVLADFGGASQFRVTPNSLTQNAFLALATAQPNLPVFQQVTFSSPRNVGGGVPENEYQTVNRVDFNISDKTQLYGRYALQSQVFAQGTNAYSPYAGFSTGSTNFNQNFLLNLTHTFSTNLVSQSKLAFNRLNGGQPLGAQPLVPTLYMQSNRTVSIQGVNILFPGYLPYSPGNAIPFNGAQNVYQFNQDLSYTVGKHSWRFGGQIVHIRDNKTFGAYSYAVEALGNNNPEALSNFLTGNLASFSVAIDPKNQFPGGTLQTPVGPPSFSRSNRYTEWAAYANDSIRYTPRLTLNLGLRYEYYGVQHSAQGPHFDANFFYGQGNTIQERIRNGQFLTSETSPVGGLWKPDRNNFAPRIGFAWDIFGDGKTSFRGGYGIAYERNFGNVTFNVLFNPPNYGVIALNANTCATAACTGSGLTVRDVPTIAVSIANYGPLAGSGVAKPFSPVSARAVDPNIVNAFAHFWSTSLEHQIAPNTVVSLEYSGSKGDKLYSISDINRTGAALVYGLGPIPNAVGATTTRLNPFITSANQRGNLGFSLYNGITASIESNNFRNMGLTFTARYTYSIARDNLSSTFADTAQTFWLGFTDTFNPGLDYGRADFDVRHRVTTSFNYEIPFNKFTGAAKHLLGGWSLNGTAIIRSGYPFTIFDCSFQSTSCARLVPSAPIVINSNNPPDTGDANSFTMVNLSNQVLPSVAPNPITNNYDFGPYPASMTRRNQFTGPGFWNVDMGLFKRIRFTERTSLQLRAEVFNLFNHANLYTDYGSQDASSGNILAHRGVTETLGLERRNVQLAAKFIF